MINKAQTDALETGAPPATSPSKNETQKLTKATQRKWFESLEFIVESILKNQGSAEAAMFVDTLVDRLREAGVVISPTTTTP